MGDDRYVSDETVAMPIKLKFGRGQKIAGYVAFSVFAFVFCFWLSFPYDAVRQRIVSDASAQGIRVQMGWIGPGFLGVSASNVRISKKIEDLDANPPAAFLIKSVAIRPSLFPPGVAFGGSAMGGNISGRMGGFSGTSIRLDFNGLNTSDPNFKEVTGVDASGKISGHLSLDMPTSTIPGPSKSKEADLSQANGALSLKLDRVVVNGGTITVPVMGQLMPVALEKLSIGDLEARVKFEKGQGRIEKFQGKGDDLELLASGTIKLARQVDYAESNIDVKLKVEPDAQKRLGAMAMGLTFLPADKENPEFRTAKITGFLARPNFSPGR